LLQKKKADKKEIAQKPFKPVSGRVAFTNYKVKDGFEKTQIAEIWKCLPK
jgi:hypothetical protein